MKNWIFLCIFAWANSLYAQDSLWLKKALSYPILSDTLSDSKYLVLKANGLKAFVAQKNMVLDSILLFAKVGKENFKTFNDLRDDTLLENYVYYLENKKEKADINLGIAQENQYWWAISQKYAIQLPKLLNYNLAKEFDEVKKGQVVFLQNKKPKKTPLQIIPLDKKENAQAQPSNQNKNQSATTNVQEKIILPQPKNQAIAVFTPPQDQTTQPQENTLPQNPKQQSTQEQQNTEKPIFHVVKKGERIYGIAQKYGINVNDIFAWNALNANSIIKTGDKIYLQDGHRPTPPPQEKKTEKKILDTYITDVPDFYVTQSQENIDQIAQKYGLSGQDIMRWNQLQSKDLPPNCRIFLKELPKANTDFHIVEKGETLYAVARRFQISPRDLMTWNNLNNNSILKLGERISLKAPQKDSTAPINTPQDNNTQNSTTDNNSNAGLNLDELTQLIDQQNKSRVAGVSADGNYYVVQEELEELDDIAQKVGVSATLLQEINQTTKNIFPKDERIWLKAGVQTGEQSDEKLPDAVIDEKQDDNTQPEQPTNPVNPANVPALHIVQSYYENLTNIAQKYGLSPQTLAQLNGLPVEATLFPGTEIKLK